MSVLEQMEPIALEAAKTVRLTNRMDNKYVASADRLEELLERVAERYYVQEIEASRVAPYRTLYFDTDDLAMYTMHHNGKLNRQKVRVRTYRLTDTTFFELKNKNNKGRTSKVRLPIDVQMFDHPEEMPEVKEFVERLSPFTFHLSPFTSLHACLGNRFERITLVDKEMRERVTVDRNITFHNCSTNRDADISGILVVEVKHEAGVPQSEMEKALHEMHIQPQKISKYCIGTALTNPSVKKNCFKPTLSIINYQLSIKKNA